MGESYSMGYAEGQKDLREEFDKRLKGVEQQLAEILNLGPTVTQKKMWLDEFFDLTNEETKLILNKLRKLK